MAWDGPRDCRAWFSPGTSRRAGVGLVVKESFLAQFDPAMTRWEEVVPGRAAVLRLKGPLGALDLYTLYFATGTAVVVQPRGSNQGGERLRHAGPPTAGGDAFQIGRDDDACRPGSVDSRWGLQLGSR